MSHISGIVYSLRKQYGSSLRYIELLSSDVNRTTGRRTIVKKTHDIDVVHLPAMLMRKFIQDIGFLAANKNFTYGGLNDFNSVGFLFEDLCFDPNLNGYIVWQEQRYEKTSIENFNNGEAYLLMCKLVQGGEAFDVEPVNAGNTFQMQGVATCELN